MNMQELRLEMFRRRTLLQNEESKEVILRLLESRTADERNIHDEIITEFNFGAFFFCPVREKIVKVGVWVTKHSTSVHCYVIPFIKTTLSDIEVKHLKKCDDVIRMDFPDWSLSRTTGDWDYYADLEYDEDDNPKSSKITALYLEAEDRNTRNNLKRALMSIFPKNTFKFEDWDD